MTPASCAAVDGILSPPAEHCAGARLFADSNGKWSAETGESSPNLLFWHRAAQPNRDIAGADAGPPCPRRMISA